MVVSFAQLAKPGGCRPPAHVNLGPFSRDKFPKLGILMPGYVYFMAIIPLLSTKSPRGLGLFTIFPCNSLLPNYFLPTAFNPFTKKYLNK